MEGVAAADRGVASQEHLGERRLLILAFRNIFRNRLRTTLTLAAVGCGVAAIVVSGGFVEDVFVQLRESTIHSRLGHIQIIRPGYLDFGRRDPFKYLITDPADVLNQSRALPHVQIATTRVYFSGLANNGRADLPIIGEGVEPENERRLGTATVFVAGQPLREGDPFAANLGEGLAASLKLQPGSSVTLTVSTPGGALNALEFKVTGIFRTFSKDYDDHAVRIPRTAVEELLSTKAVHSIVLGLDDTAATDVTVAALIQRLPGDRYEVKPWHELADFYSKTVALYRRQFGALQLMILVLLILSVASTVNMVVHERTGEFGTLLALGTRRRDVFRLVLLENALLGGIGAILGVALGVAVALLLTVIGIEMPPPPGSTASYTATIRVVPSFLGIAAITGAIAAIIASVLPGRRAARLQVVDALRHNI
jgi:putative ABC transport system permease protein